MDSQRSLQVLSIGLDFRAAAAHGPTASESPPVRNQFGLTETSAPTPSRTRLTRNRHLGLTFRRSHLKLIVRSITRRRRSQLAPAPRYAGLAAGPVARDCFGSRGAFARAMGLATERSHQGGESWSIVVARSFELAWLCSASSRWRRAWRRPVSAFIRRGYRSSGSRNKGHRSDRRQAPR